MGKGMRNALKYSGLVLMVVFFAGFTCVTGYAGEQGANADRQQLDILIAEYFASWSKPDMAIYKACFHPAAAIYFVTGAGKAHYVQLDEFIVWQAKAHQAAQERQQRLFEVPTHVSLNIRGRLA